MNLSADNVGGAEYIINNWSIMGIISGTYSVDTFFFLAGLLACYLGMKYISKKKEPNKSCNYMTSDIPLMYFQRYLRFVAAILTIFILIYTDLYFPSMITFVLNRLTQISAG